MRLVYLFDPRCRLHPTDEFDAPVNVYIRLVEGAFGCRAFERVPGNMFFTENNLVERELGEG